MPQAFKLKVSDFDEEEEYNAGLAQLEQAQERLSASGSSATHARHLQNMLVNNYHQVSSDKKLPIRQRLAIIVGATSALWAMIGVGIYAVVLAGPH
ncbi:hypothetical protein [Novosphingobium sp. 9U]|uniref:hypothetical protein n=1 Tax=Novosphingobium sp. 9U TaxID=2653158 RepID=UPI0012EFE28E|nr:hypothetical protein [Novosphingobium sp. 9U]VWX50992.1 hypothetical protein NOVOSPHI9U_370013 [Novosphingobium sp. 9U]